MAKATLARMADTMGPRFGAVPAENGTFRGVIYGVRGDGTPETLEARRPTYGEAMADAWGASHTYGNAWEGRGDQPYLRRGNRIFFR